MSINSDIYTSIQNSPSREAQRNKFTELCEFLWPDFRWIFLFSGEGTLEFRNPSLEDIDYIEPKIWHWDYADCGFSKISSIITESDRDKIRELQESGFINPENLPKNWDGFWIHWWWGNTNMDYLKRVIKRSRTIRFIHWWIWSKRPEAISSDFYDIGYAESSQCDPEITCWELVSLVKLWWYIIIRNSCYSWSSISAPLTTKYKNMVTQLVVNPFDCWFHLFQRTK